jgi:hypothetical protein
VKPLDEQTLYEILDVPPDANAAVIAEAVERASALYAPGSLATYTLMAPEEEQLMSRRLEEARTTLLDPTARSRYDERLSLGAPAPSAGAPATAGPLREVDPALRAAWPELPPSAAPERAGRPLDWGEEDEVELGESGVPTPPPAPAAPPASAPRVLAPPPAQEPRPLPPVIPALQPSRPPAPATEPPATPVFAAAPPGPRPILLSREVVQPSAPTQVAAASPSATPPPGVVPEGTSWSGEVLRNLREARGLSLQQISERTKVTRHHIENIESDRYEALPAQVYLRGILLSIARELRLDGQKVARSYLERVTAAVSTTTPVQRPR